MTSRLKIWMVICLFALVALPFVSTFIIYQPDERHYTNAALIMQQDHEWLTPKFADDTPTYKKNGHRFQKPILTYWGVLAGFAAAGVNIFGARIGSLLVSCGTLWLTYRMAKRLTKCEDTARLAALVLATHVQFLSAAARANPDALLCFFTLMSLDGFLKLLESDEWPTVAGWQAYGGAALVAETKGLLAVVIVAFVWAFALIQRRDKSAWRRLLHWPGILAGVAVGGAWYVYIYWQYGSRATGDFYTDQVAQNLRSWWAPVRQVPRYSLVLLLNFLPWCLPMIELLARGGVSGAIGKMSGLSRRYILFWLAVVIGVFGLGNGDASVRYLLPVAPLVAIWLADGLQSAQARLIFSPQRVMVCLLTLVLLADFVGLAVNTETGFSSSMAVGFAALAMTVGLVWYGTKYHHWYSGAEGLGLATFLLFAVGFFVARPVVLPERAEQILAELREGKWDQRQPVLVVGDLKLAGRLRLLAGASDAVVYAPDVSQVGRFSLVVVEGDAAAKLAGLGYDMRPAATMAGALKPAEFWNALRDRRLMEALREQGQKYFLATPARL